ncbi:MAG: glutamate synthase large subunit, partial [Trueperaceae bacterium]|nr:glutamate synthase large subunit [Trueperaceae bacterium]
RDLLPVIEPGGSDSAALDNALELLTLSGRELPHALMMLVPQAYEKDAEVDPDLRGFFDYHGTLMEPWDGPAALAISDGRFAVAALDRNGLRPQRYWLTSDDLLVVASEAGVLPLDPETVIERGRLGPGRLLAVDTTEGRLLRDADIKQRYALRRPYREWVERFEVRLPDSVRAPTDALDSDAEALNRMQLAFGYSAEDLDRIVEPMAFGGEVPVGSMGDDTPLAVLSRQPQPLYRYFKQRFAQVTNPPIDPLREELVMSLATVLGPRASVLEEEPEAARVARFAGPVIDAAKLAALQSQDELGCAVIECLFPATHGAAGLAAALERLADEAQELVESGVSVLILSDRGVNAERAPVPMLLAVGAVHNRLLLVGRRTRAAIVCDTGEPREDHHFACLIGYGAALIHPYLAMATARQVGAGTKGRDPKDPAASVKDYVKALEKGLLKTMSKMGISTLAAYRGAQVFETVGLSSEVVDDYFSGTPTHLGGASLATLALDVLELHQGAFPSAAAEPEVAPRKPAKGGGLPDRGIYRFRKAGEYHSLNPDVFKALHKAVRTESFEAFQEYVKAVEERPPTSIRDLLDYRRADAPLPLSEVEPIESIVKRFTTQAMSHGSVSRETHEALAIAMNRLGGKSNAGEGGEDPVRFKPFAADMPERSYSPTWHPKAGDNANSAIKQVASGRFGVTPAYLANAREIEIKMAQGSKPGEGGQIPGFKVTAEIASIRHAVEGVTLISPPPHHDIYSIEDLAQLIYDLKRVNPVARIGVKLVSTTGVGTIASGVAKGYADNIQISGNDGGTGASPLSSMKHAGLPWELGLLETQRALVENGLRGRVGLRVDGGLKTGRDVVIAAMLGADEFGFGTTALVAVGCAMIRQCHLNTCPVGIATQDPVLRAKFAGDSEHVVRLFLYLAQQVRMLLAEMGLRSLGELVGRGDLLTVRSSLAEVVARDVDLEVDDLVARAVATARIGGALHRVDDRNDRPSRPGRTLDSRMAEDVLAALERPERPVSLTYEITNRERSIGSRLSGRLAALHGDAGPGESAVTVTFNGSAGQSFGAFNLPGVRLMLVGEGQDYVGKSMAGGELVLRPRADEDERRRQVIGGNTVLYGATGGSLFAAGVVGERVCVRNSGATAVVEGCGDHGCEYMTGGTVVVLGGIGRNFAAGMSGGVAYLYAEDEAAERRHLSRVNAGMVSVTRLGASGDEGQRAEIEQLRGLLVKHLELTGSRVAAVALAAWDAGTAGFLRVSPELPSEEQPPMTAVAGDAVLASGQSARS